MGLRLVFSRAVLIWLWKGSEKVRLIGRNSARNSVEMKEISTVHAMVVTMEPKKLHHWEERKEQKTRLGMHLAQRMLKVYLMGEEKEPMKVILLAPW